MIFVEQKKTHICQGNLSVTIHDRIQARLFEAFIHKVFNLLQLKYR